MEENNTNETNTQNVTDVREVTKYSVNNHWKEYIGVLIAAFTGGFLAMYFVADQVFAKSYNAGFYMPDRIERQMMKDFNKMYERERKAFEHDFGKFNDVFDEKPDKHHKQMNKFSLNPFFIPDSATDSIKIRTKFDDDDYKVIIDLKAFGGDASKINYNVSGRKLTVFGKSKVKDKNFEQDIAFSQDFILPANANIANISKEQDGNRLEIKVPLNK